MQKKYKTFMYLIWVGSCVSYSYNILNLERKRVTSLTFFKIPNFCGWTVTVFLLWSTLALAGTTLISCTMMLSSWIIRTTGLLEVWVILYIRPVWPGTSDHCTRGWVELLPLVVPFLHRSIGTIILFTMMPLNKSAEPYFQQQKINFFTFWGWLETTLGS